MTEKVDDIPVRAGKSALAQILNVARSTIGKHLSKEGAPQPDSDRKYDVIEVEAFINTERDRAPVTTVTLGINAAKERKLNVVADLAELELAKQLKTVIPIEDATKFIHSQNAKLKKQLLALPKLLAPELVGHKTADIAEILTDAVRNICEEISEYGRSS